LKKNNGKESPGFCYEGIEFCDTIFLISNLPISSSPVSPRWRFSRSDSFGAICSYLKVKEFQF
jgi:hypothetical protein